jgi:hypothetical protein
MSSFNKRGESFEKKYALDEEQKFKASVRRNKLLGLWAAEKMGLSGTEAAEYAKEVIKADFSAPGGEDVFRKIRTTSPPRTSSSPSTRSGAPWRNSW